MGFYTNTINGICSIIPTLGIEYGNLCIPIRILFNYHTWVFNIFPVRECGALEAADTLLGIPLYGTDPSTVFRWVDINMIRSRRVKENHIIQGLPSDCKDILYPSLIDTYYPNRPAKLESTNLYTFMSWYDVLNKQRSKAATYIHNYDNLYVIF